MRSSLRQFSGFIAEMSVRAGQSDAQDLANWAVQELAGTVGFDSAWYGWANITPDSVDIHAQSSHNLTDNYYGSWCEMSEQDLLAAAVRERPGRTAVYDRFGNAQTDGMITLADNYGLKRMATAMHGRPGRSASFYLSSYRGGPHSRAWSTDELDYLQCAVDQLSSAMKFSVAAQQPGCGRQSFYVSDEGVVILGLQSMQEQMVSLGLGGCDDRLPEYLRNLVNLTGEHVLVDRQLIVTCERDSGDSDLQLCKMTLRPLRKFDLLTRREAEVARLLADGKSHKEAARRLGVAPSTVRNQTQSIYSKLGVNSRAEMTLAVPSSQ